MSDIEHECTGLDEIDDALECTEWIEDLAEPMTAGEIAAWGLALSQRSTLLTTQELRLVATVRALLMEAGDIGEL
jgi:hypothetical protein